MVQSDSLMFAFAFEIRSCNIFVRNEHLQEQLSITCLNHTSAQKLAHHDGLRRLLRFLSFPLKENYNQEKNIVQHIAGINNYD